MIGRQFWAPLVLLALPSLCTSGCAEPEPTTIHAWPHSSCHEAREVEFDSPTTLSWVIATDDFLSSKEGGIVVGRGEFLVDSLPATFHPDLPEDLEEALPSNRDVGDVGWVATVRVRPGGTDEWSEPSFHGYALICPWSGRDSLAGEDFAVPLGAWDPWCKAQVEDVGCP